MRLLLSILLLGTVSLTAQAQEGELSTVGEVWVKVKKAGQAGFDVVKAYNEKVVDSSSIALEYHSRINNGADDVWRLVWDVELQPVLKEQNALFIKYTIRTDISEIHSLNFEDILDETILASAQLNVWQGVRNILGFDTEWELAQYIRSENDDILIDIGASEHFNWGSLAAAKEWELVEPFGFKVGKFTIFAGGKVWAGGSRLTGNDNISGLNVNFNAEAGVRWSREGDHKIPVIDKALGDVELSWSLYAGEQNIGGRDVDAAGSKVGVNFENIPVDLVLDHRRHDVDGDSDNSTVIQAIWPIGGKRNRGGAPDPVPDKKY